jgi:phosphatidylglycerol---prolipoprotein diacylglyceryl transferase
VFPYIDLPKIYLPFELPFVGRVPIQWFGLLVATAVVVGTMLARWRAKKLGINREKLDSFISWMLVGGFLGAHVLDTIFYHPSELVHRPWSLIFIWEGLSSFGGFIGALCGIFAWKKWRAKGQSVLGLIEIIASVFPIAWIFGRAGCAVVHDHRGMAAPAGSWLAVAFPDGPAYDLGLLEALFAVVISIIFVSTWHRRWKPGFYSALVSLLYAPVRFYLDHFRLTEAAGTGDEHYFGLTPAQYACIALFGFGVYMAVRTARSTEPPMGSEMPEEPEEEKGKAKAEEEPLRPKSKAARGGRKRR